MDVRIYINKKKKKITMTFQRIRIKFRWFVLGEQFGMKSFRKELASFQNDDEHSYSD